jgi:hypothetical protein
MTLPALKEDVPATIRAILGPPALLSSEDAAIYEATLAHFAREVAPKDLIAWMLIKDLADHRLEIARYRRIRVALVRHPVDRRAEEMEQEANANYQQELLVLDETVDELRAKIEANGTTDVVQDYVKIDAYAAEQRDGAAQSRNAMIAAIRSHHPTDRDIAAGLPHWIDGYQQLDRCLQGAEERFIATLRDLERHAAGFGKTLRHADVIEGEVLACEEAV